MDTLKLTYFDFPGGRAEPARLALHLGGIAFEDHRFPFADFAEVRKTTPLRQVPTLHINGVQVTRATRSPAMPAGWPAFTPKTRCRPCCATRCWARWRTST